MLVRNYFTSKIEIKPQPSGGANLGVNDYFTSKIEIKPQPPIADSYLGSDYFTSKIEIKPQLICIVYLVIIIILHQK